MLKKLFGSKAEKTLTIKVLFVIQHNIIRPLQKNYFMKKLYLSSSMIAFIFYSIVSASHAMEDQNERHYIPALPIECTFLIKENFAKLARRSYPPPSIENVKNALKNQGSEFVENNTKFTSLAGPPTVVNVIQEDADLGLGGIHLSPNSTKIEFIYIDKKLMSLAGIFSILSQEEPQIEHVEIRGCGEPDHDIYDKKTRYILNSSESSEKVMLFFPLSNDDFVAFFEKFKLIQGFLENFNMLQQ